VSDLESKPESKPTWDARRQLELIQRLGFDGLAFEAGLLAGTCMRLAEECRDTLPNTAAALLRYGRSVHEEYAQVWDIRRIETFEQGQQKQEASHATVEE
jgi:hypothetical protein